MQDFNNDLIRRTDALNMVHNFFLAKIKTVSGDREEIPMGELDPFLKDNKELSAKIKSIPAAEAVPVVHGSWEETDYVKYDGHGECVRYPKQGLKCSNCLHVYNKHYLWDNNFCPNCGAKMDGKAV